MYLLLHEEMSTSVHTYIVLFWYITTIKHMSDTQIIYEYMQYNVTPTIFP